MKSIVGFVVKSLHQNLKIKDIAQNVLKFKNVKKQPSDNAKSERLCHTSKEWNDTCYKTFNEPSTGK